MVGYGKKAFHKPPQALARKRYEQAIKTTNIEFNDQLKNSETILVGSWIRSGENVIADEICKRIEYLQANYLIKVPVELNWEVLYQDPNDKRYWLLTYPHSDWHGGGPPTLKVLTQTEIKEKLEIK